MRLYSTTGATRLDDPEHGTFDVDEAGGFNFPDEVSDRLHAFHMGGKAMWESDIERQQRLMSEELERRKDPATLLAAVEQLVKAAQATTVLTAVAAGATESVQGLAAALAAPEGTTPAPAAAPEPVPAPEAAKPSRKRAATKPADQ
ncbi:hypothetical protein ACIA7S_28310 [Streptomyces sp. NPDC051643]|uniref:hypothetical protein n=1 Tax=Streptomyces sp. NPDC051643 TaxID=3365665 RepID=UPI0037AD2A32